MDVRKRKIKFYIIFALILVSLLTGVFVLGGKELETTNDYAFPYYCPNCDMFINKNKTEGKKLEK